MSMIYDIGSQYDKAFKAYEPFPRSSDREAWQSLDPALKEKIIDQADRYLGYDYPRLTASMFLGFYQEGDRSNYQKVYSQIRMALNTMVIGECLVGDGRYMEDILNGLYAICEESAWNLPAHNTYIRDTMGPLLPDYDRPVLALFSCETGANLALIDYLLGDELDRISPVIRKRLKSELDRRIKEPYLKEHFWWMGRGDEPMNNWTIWCTQSILMTFFLTDTSEEKRLKAFKKSCQSVDYFLKEYEEDGCCDEGALYYRKAGLCLMTVLEILNTVTGMAFRSVYKNKKIYNMAEFILNMQVEGKYYINFADCSAVLDPSGAREFLFGKRTGNARLMAYATQDYGRTDVYNEDDMNLYNQLLGVMTHEALLAYDQDIVVDHPDVFYESVEMALVRDEQFCLAVKSDDSDESTNHNDVGSYTLFNNGIPFIIDIGVETYSAKTFSPYRYEIWTMQSDYHNLPTINGHMQKDGSEYKAREVKVENSPERFHVTMDIAKAYPQECGADKFYRSIAMVKGKEVVIEDTCISSNEAPCVLISNMIFYNKPIISGHTLAFEDGGWIGLEGTIDKMELERLPIRDDRLKWAWDHDLYRVRITYKNHRLITRIRSTKDGTYKK